MSTKLSAHEHAVSRIFSDDFVFRIPPYQRPYAWTSEQAGELLDDFLDFIRFGSGNIDDLPEYFLGSIVLIKPEGDPDADVIDGQQRLTTLTLLLSAIRANIGPENSSDITQLIYEKGSQILGTQDRFRLSLRERDRDFFQKYVQLDDGFSKLLAVIDVNTDSQKNIRDNARLFDRRLKSMSESDRVKLAQFIVTRCYLVVVSTPDLQSAYRIFSVLNTRGLDLSATDILKAEVIGQLPLAQHHVYTRKWEDTEEDLGRAQFGDLFSHVRMVFRKAKPQGSLLEEFRGHVLRGLDPKHFIDEVLMPMASVYEEITDGTYSSSERADRVNYYIRWLNRIEFNDWVPPALAFAIRRRNQPELMEKFFKDLERLSYSLLITRANVNQRIDRFSRLTRAVESGDDLFSENSPLQIGAIEQYETYQVLSGPIYESLSARARSLVLLRLDALVSGGGATYDYEVVTVEHVLPQSPSAESEWLKWFPEPEIRAKCVHCLGNLVLLTRRKNSAASNYDFGRKKSAYFTRGGVSPFSLTTHVLQHDYWTPKVVDDRQKELLGLLEQHWRLYDREDPVIEKEAAAAYQGDGTWRDDVREGLHRLGGEGSLFYIYKEVESLRLAGNRSTPRSLEAVVRRTLEENSSDSESYKGGPDLFYMPQGKGAGIWALRSKSSS